MALSSSIIEALARELEQAEQTRTQRRQISLDYPQIGIEDAYAIQQAWIALKTAKGDRIIGHKIGLTSAAMQRASNISEPDTGVLLDYMRFGSGALIETSRFIEPRIEVELAFMLGADLPMQGCTIEDVLAATDCVVPALELIDARLPRIDSETQVTRKVYDTIADNAANAAVILGTQRFAPRSIDLKWACALLHRNDEIEESGVAGAVLGHPARGIVWLANRLGGFGERLTAGQLVLAGSFTAPVPVGAGDRFIADYGPLGSIEVDFK